MTLQERACVGNGKTILKALILADSILVYMKFERGIERISAASTTGDRFYGEGIKALNIKMEIYGKLPSNP